MTALTQQDFAILQLALDVLNADTARKQKSALKRRDDTALERLHSLADDAMAVRRKLFGISAKVDAPPGCGNSPSDANQCQ